MSGTGTSAGLTEGTVRHHFEKVFVAVAVMKGCTLAIVLTCLTHTGWGTCLNEKNEELEYSRQLFNDFIKKYGKVYVDEAEFNKRLEIFRANLEEIKWLEETERGTARYGITQFSDMTRKEVFGVFREPDELEEPTERVEATAGKIPDSFDWRTRGIVTPVRSGPINCNFNWAIIATGNIESQWALRKGIKPRQLSVQQIIECSTKGSCIIGGLESDALEYVVKAGGLESEEDYPFNIDGDEYNACLFNKSRVVAKIWDFKYLSDNENKIARWLYKNGPVSVRFNSGRLNNYQNGIIYPKKGECFKYNLVTAGLVVGYGIENSSGGESIPYWIVKTSYGKGFGENGYFRMHRGSGACGINKMAIATIV